VWIPILWLLIIGSRQVSQWLGIGAVFQSQRLEEGNPIDQVVFAALIFAGLCVLARRPARVAQIVGDNKFLILFVLYEGISFVWSDYPTVALRRWLKALGDPVMVLVLLSDQLPARAVSAAISRCAYVLIPVSVLFCKYYQNLGRTFDAWGNSGYSGVTLDKNMLGYLLFTFGLFFVATFITTFRRPRAERNQANTDRMISILILCMVGWLLLIANSSTAAVALVAGSVVMVALRVVSVRKHFWSYALTVLLLGVVVNTWVSVQGTIAEAAGRDASFTGRTGLWETVLQEPINPLIGTGYSSFWLGERLLRFWAMYPNSPPIQAHNGYIEVYINLGLIGLCLLACVLWSGLTRMRNRLELSLTKSDIDGMVTMFALPFGIAYLFYNITEAAFGGTNFLFIVFLMLACSPAGVWHTWSPGAAATPKLDAPARRVPIPRMERPNSQRSVRGVPRQPEHRVARPLRSTRRLH
jgi:O-antigen ligase